MRFRPPDAGPDGSSLAGIGSSHYARRVRRLAAQTREDTYGSNRDYQHIVPAGSVLMTVPADGDLIFAAPVYEGTSPYIAAGGFLTAEAPMRVSVQLTTEDVSANQEHDVEGHWSRFGLAVEDPEAAVAQLVITAPPGAKLGVWGLALGNVAFPPGITAPDELASLTKRHLMPETFYLDHEGALVDTINVAEVVPGPQISLKKCAYCQRYLPLDPKRLGVLSFHKHNAKRTKHQNECRSCKAWRINRVLNPLRTVDQLHESSAITRERKLLLREPEILVAIKERTGAGLKSQVWERFGRRCFNCGRELELKEVQLDHTRPLAYLWPIDEYATCLCADCNNEKKEKFPVDYYSAEKRDELAAITGIARAELDKKEINPTELGRLLNNLAEFAVEWDARTFAATARKIHELRPDLDLFELLRAADTAAYEHVTQELLRRPLSVGVE